MAKVLEPISDAELKKITVVNLRNEYKKLANFYQRIMNNELIYCSHCGQWKSAATFYSSKASPDGIEHYACKECVLNECTDYDKKHLEDLIGILMKMFTMNSYKNSLNKQEKK